MSRTQNDGGLAGIISIVFLLFVGIGIGPKACINTTASVAQRFDVEGVVQSDPHSKFSGNGSSTSGTEKFSIKLKTSKGIGIFNCTSTQCASLSKGDVVTLSCFNEWHITVPDELECRFSSVKFADDDA